MTVLKTLSLTKIHGGQKGNVTVKTLDSFSLEVSKGEFVGIMGPSGSGKTTLLNLAGAIDASTSGDMIIDGRRLSS